MAQEARIEALLILLKGLNYLKLINLNNLLLIHKLMLLHNPLILLIIKIMEEAFNLGVVVEVLQEVATVGDQVLNVKFVWNMDNFFRCVITVLIKIVLHDNSNSLPLTAISIEILMVASIYILLLGLCSLLEVLGDILLEFNSNFHNSFQSKSFNHRIQRIRFHKALNSHRSCLQNQTDILWSLSN